MWSKSKQGLTRHLAAAERSFSMEHVTYVFNVPPVTALPVYNDKSDSSSFFAVRRVYCVGRNYADHAREMGSDPVKEPPFFFSKPTDAVVPCFPATTTRIPYPLQTQELHHEIELVIAIGKEGVQISAQEALYHVYGHAVGIDLTRRDLQKQAKDSRRPWDSAKGFDQSAPIGPIYPVASAGHVTDANIWLDVNGEQRQTGNVNTMIWSVPEIVSALSHSFHLQPGDLIMTGTPSGVGPIIAGDTITAGIDRLGEIKVEIVESSR